MLFHVSVSKQRDAGGVVSVNAENEILSEGVDGRAVGFCDFKLAIKLFHRFTSRAWGKDFAKSIAREHNIDFEKEQIMTKTTLKDYIYNPSLVGFAQAMNLSLANLAAELSVAMGSDLRTAMDNAQNAMEEFKDVPTPTLPPIRGQLVGHWGRNADSSGRLNRRDPWRPAHSARRCK